MAFTFEEEMKIENTLSSIATISAKKSINLGIGCSIFTFSIMTYFFYQTDLSRYVHGAWAHGSIAMIFLLTGFLLSFIYVFIKGIGFFPRRIEMDRFGFRIHRYGTKESHVFPADIAGIGRTSQNGRVVELTIEMKNGKEFGVLADAYGLRALSEELRKLGLRIL